MLILSMLILLIVDALSFIKKVSTILMNVANPYQNYDFPMVEPAIDSYSPKKINYPIILDKLLGNLISKDYNRYH